MLLICLLDINSPAVESSLELIEKSLRDKENFNFNNNLAINTLQIFSFFATDKWTKKKEMASFELSGNLVFNGNGTKKNGVEF